MFHALADQLKRVCNDVIGHEDLRKKLVQHLKDNPVRVSKSCISLVGQFLVLK